LADRKLIKFDLTRDDIPPHPDGGKAQTPYAASMANEDLRVVCVKHPGQFQDVWTLACQMMELANPGMAVITKDHAINADGHINACTVTVVPERS
jgi:hypothetical protein